MSVSAPEHLTAEHDVSAFHSGTPELDNWLKRRALANEALGTSRTYVVTEGGRVVTRRLKLLMDRVTAGAGELVLGQQDHRQIPGGVAEPRAAVTSNPAKRTRSGPIGEGLR